MRRSGKFVGAYDALLTCRSQNLQGVNHASLVLIRRMSRPDRKRWSPHEGQLYRSQRSVPCNRSLRIFHGLVRARSVTADRAHTGSKLYCVVQRFMVSKQFLFPMPARLPMQRTKPAWPGRAKRRPGCRISAHVPACAAAGMQPSILSCRYQMKAADGFAPARAIPACTLKACPNRRQAHLMIKVSV